MVFQFLHIYKRIIEVNVFRLSKLSLDISLFIPQHCIYSWQIIQTDNYGTLFLQKANTYNSILKISDI